MSHTFLAMNELAGHAEWDSVVEDGSSTIIQSADAAFSERGSLGLRVTIVGASGAYVQKNNIGISLSPGGSVYIGEWIRFPAYPSAATTLIYPRSTFGYLGFICFYDTGRLRPGLYHDDLTGYLPGYSDVLTAGRWYYIAWEIRRATSAVASDGGLALWVDGQPQVAGYACDNYDCAINLDYAKFGVPIMARDGFVLDFDGIKIATTYPEPFVPTPLTEYPEARRTVVLFRQASADSFAFADYCVSELGVPRSNLCPLPNATANETLADYATFQSEVETDLAAWLALNPTVAANCSCFLIGHGVPGYFDYAPGGLYTHKISATSRLMNFGTAFSMATDNPLYNPATVARLTKTTLGGKYLCTRIDADTLANAKLIIDRGLAVAGTATLPATDKIFSDDSDYLASLACQHLRIQSTDYADYTDLENDAFVFGYAAGVTFGAAGSRACFADDSADSADTLRATSELFDAIITNLYAAGLGFSADGCSLNAECFFEMLRIGGTLAEAVAVSVAKLDYTAVAVGLPFMTVAFRLGGYNVYRGVGGIEDINWNSPVAYLRAGQDSIAFDQDLLPGQRYIYAVRTVSSAGAEERNTQVITYVETDEQGNLLPAPLARPTDLAVDVRQSSLLIGFSCYAPLGFSEADGFDVLSDNGTGQLDLDNPVATVERSRNGQFDFETSITRPGTPVLLSVRAREDQRTGPISEILFVPLSDAPAPAQIL